MAPAKPLAAVAAALSAGALAMVGLAAAGNAAVAQTGHDATARVLKLDVGAAPGATAFGGTLGAVTAVAPSQQSVWDQSDPDGVRAFVHGWHGAPAGPGTSFANVHEASGTHRAEVSWAGVGLGIRSGAGTRNLISFGSIHTWAQCTHAPATPTQQAYSASDSNTAYLFDDLARRVAEGTQTVQSSGAELGLADIGTATLTITMRHVQETTAGYAHAAFEITVDAVLAAKSGEPRYTGPLLNAVIGDVTVRCEAAPPPTTSTTTSTTTPETTTSTPVTTTPETTTPTSSTTPTSTSTTSTTDTIPGGTTGDTPPPSPLPDDPAPTPPDGDGGHLATTGVPVGLPAGIGAGLLLILAGVALVRRRAS